MLSSKMLSPARKSAPCDTGDSEAGLPCTALAVTELIGNTDAVSGVWEHHKDSAVLRRDHEPVLFQCESHGHTHSISGNSLARGHHFTCPDCKAAGLCESEVVAHLSERTMGRPNGSGGNGFSSGALLALVSNVLSGLPLAATAKASRVPGIGAFAALPCWSCLLSLKMAPPLYTSPGESPCCGLHHGSDKYQPGARQLLQGTFGSNH